MARTNKAETAMTAFRAALADYYDANGVDMPYGQTERTAHNIAVTNKVACGWGSDCGMKFYPAGKGAEFGFEGGL